MRRALILVLMVGALCAALPVQAASGRIVKVLPQFLDLKGRNSISPSLYDRDAYQVMLRDNPDKRSGMRFYVQWKVKGSGWEPLRVRVELRGVAEGNSPRQLVLEQPAVVKRGWFGRWAEINLVGDDYKEFGAVTAWRATLWEGDKLLDEQRSFLW
ncbi:MAG TPA: hypothetical protein VEC99_06110 [Clostridia bacterium]|nr:hypothetical protein [Clostridia bacterium]